MKCRWKRLGQHQLELLIRLCSQSNSMKCEWKRFGNRQLKLWWLQLNLMKCGWKKLGGVMSSTKASCSFTNDRWKKFDEKNLESDEKITINHDEMWMKKPWMNSQACEGGGAMAMGRMSTFKSLYVVLCATYYFFLLSFCSMRSNFLQGIQNCGIYYKKHSPFLLWMKRKKIEMTCLQMFGFVQSFKMSKINVCWKTITLSNIEEKPKKNCV